MGKETDRKMEGASSPEGSERLSLLLSEAQLILSEKRTALSVMRTGIAVFALPLSVLSVLIATSNYYNPAKVMHLLIPVLLINLALIGLGIYLVVRALKRIHVLDRMIQGLKHRSKDIAELVE
jgi:uncharacterized membrane protein YidH (DUF202 family)